MTTQTASTEIERDPIREFVDEYEFRSDAGDYTPTEADRAMLEDFAHGLLAFMADGAEPVACKHEAYHGQCVHCGVLIRNGKPVHAFAAQSTPRPRKITGRSALRVQPEDTTNPQREF